MNTFRFFRAGLIAAFLGCVILAGPERAMAQRPIGIDVSDYQSSSINWSTLKNTYGISFGWAKASEGTCSSCGGANWPKYVANAKAAGVYIGPYHFARYDIDGGTNGAVTEANYFWSVVGGNLTADGLSLMPMLDVEASFSGQTQTTLSQWVDTWCTTISNSAYAGGRKVKPCIYMSSSNAKNFLNSTATKWNTDIADWPYSHANAASLAQSASSPPAGIVPWTPSTNWQFWQYDDQNVAETYTDGDGDIFNGTLAQLTNTMLVTTSAPLPPTITMQPSNVTVIEGGTVSFSVVATPIPLTYQWLVNGANISGATGSAFALSNVPQSATGQYSVAVTGSSGTTMSSNALLTVVPMITGVAVTPRSSSAIITWNTSMNASGQAMYSLDTSYGSVLPMASALTTQHSTMLVGLQSGMTYNFKLVSTNSPFGGVFTGSFSTDVSLIVQSAQARYSGIWTVDSAASNKYSPYYEYAPTANGSDTALAFFRPNIVTPGNYDVYLWYSDGTNRSQNAPVTVSYQGASVEDFVDESINGGSWQLLVAGAPFAAGTNGYVRLGNGSGEAGKVVIADAVRFVYSAGQDLPANNSPPSWWVNYYFDTNSVDSSQDYDGDGYSALAEYIIGTDPTDPTSYLHVRGQPTPDGSGVQVIFSPYYFNAGRQYQLQGRAGVTGGIWTNLPASAVLTNGNGEGVLTVTNLVGSQSFLRVSVSMTQ